MALVEKENIKVIGADSKGYESAPSHTIFSISNTRNSVYLVALFVVIMLLGQPLFSICIFWEL